MATESEGTNKKLVKPRANHKVDTTKQLFRTQLMTGRKLILSSETEVTADNILKIINKAMNIHTLNSSEIDYLWKYRNGEQPILHRIKRGGYDDIVNKIVENRADEIVNFKIGYYVGEPIQYTSKKDDPTHLETMQTFNDFMYAVNKASQDQDIVEWQMVCGTAYRLILPNNNKIMSEYKPFNMFTLDPRDTFIVRSVETGNEPLMAVMYYKDETELAITHYTCYTKDAVYRISNGNFDGEPEVNPLGMIPIIEYPANNSRTGAFELVLPLLDELNNIDSNRMDAIEQTVQAFIKFINCDISPDDFETFKEMGAIMVASSDGRQADVDVVKTDLDQSQTQTTKEDIYNAILEICGIPSRTGGASTSDTGAAVILRDGYAMAESRAKVFENMFKRSEMDMLTIALHICDMTEGITLDLRPWDIETKFTRRNYENIVSKAQVLCEMLNNPKVHPILAYQSCGLFPDPEYAYAISDKYYNDMLAKYETHEITEDNEDEESLRADRQIVEEDQGNDNKGV